MKADIKPRECLDKSEITKVFEKQAIADHGKGELPKKDSTSKDENDKNIEQSKQTEKEGDVLQDNKLKEGNDARFLNSSEDKAEEKVKKEKKIKKEKSQPLNKCKDCPYISRSEKQFARHQITHHSDNKHKCEQCGSVFTGKRVLASHIKVVHLLEGFTCTYCDVILLTTKKLDRHISVRHSGEGGQKQRKARTRERKLKVHNCDACDYSCYNSNSLARHIESKHDSTINTCNECDKEFRVKQELVVHKRNVHQAGYLCTFCDFTCKEGTEIRLHRRKEHPEQMFGGRVNKKVAWKTEVKCESEWRENPLKEECKEESKTDQKVKLEGLGGLRSGFLEGTEIQNGVKLKQRLKLGMKIDPEVYEAASRSHPSHAFVTKPGLSMHTLLHIEGRPLKFCKFFFNERDEQMAYFYCAARTRFKCRISAKALCLDKEKREFQLVTYSGKHNDNCDGQVFGKGNGKRLRGLEPIACNICDFKAENRHALLDHLQKCHENEEKRCWRCDFHTIDVFSLKSHLEEHQKKALKTCPHCTSTFKTWDHRRVHIDSQHNGIRYACDECDFKGKQKVHLRIHKENVHLKLRYYCDECPYNTGQKSHLSTHKKVVHEGFIVRCDQCDYTTGYAFELKKHWRRRHSEFAELRRANRNKVESEKKSKTRRVRKEKVHREKKVRVPKQKKVKLSMEEKKMKNKLRRKEIYEKKKVQLSMEEKMRNKIRRKEIYEKKKQLKKAEKERNATGDLSKQTPREKALQRLKKQYGVKNQVPPKITNEITSEGVKSAFAEVSRAELKMKAYVQSVAAIFKPSLKPISTEKIDHNVFDAKGLEYQKSSRRNSLTDQGLKDFPTYPNEEKPITFGSQADIKEALVERNFDPFEKVDKMKEINQHLSIFSSKSKSSVGNSLEVDKRKVEDVTKDLENETQQIERTSLSENLSLTEEAREKDNLLPQEKLVDSIVSQGKGSYQDESSKNIIDSIIDDEDESEDTEPKSGEEQAQNVDSFTESESVLSHYPGDGESCLQKNIGEKKINKAEEIENATEEMDLALVDKNSKAWEDLIVKRVARQMQMK